MATHLPGEPQDWGEHACGYATSTGNCGQPSTWHLAAGHPPEHYAGYCMQACDEHFPWAQAAALDWHPFAGVCNMPGTKWVFRGRQGEGFCYWPEAEQHNTETANEKEPQHA